MKALAETSNVHGLSSRGAVKPPITSTGKSPTESTCHSHRTQAHMPLHNILNLMDLNSTTTQHTPHHTLIHTNMSYLACAASCHPGRVYSMFLLLVSTFSSCKKNMVSYCLCSNGCFLLSVPKGNTKYGEMVFRLFYSCLLESVAK